AAQLPVLVVGDINPGGVFAGLFGTLALLSAEDQALVCGFVVNKFRGDPALLEPGLRMLQELTGRPTLGVLPWAEGLELDVEDSLGLSARVAPVPALGRDVLRVSVVRLPRLSNWTDIDRGGAFAHLYGTWALLSPEDRALLHGFVLNKFRGDPALLAPGPQQLERLTGVATVATLPMVWHHGLPEEDGVFDARGAGAGEASLTVAVIAYPRISNLDEFQPLANVPGLRLRWVRTPAGLDGADWIILPGSKNTPADLEWLRAQGLAPALARFAERGGRILGVCGGLQMLGEALVDPQEIAGNMPGLGLLPLVTQFAATKTVQRTKASFASLCGPWAALSGLALDGYEIHVGRTAQHAGMAAARVALPGALGWQNAAGNVLGVYLHGLFEQPQVLQALFGATVPTLDSVFDRLADVVDRHFDTGVLPALLAC
ncbi:MAG: cobyric acid synthase, partial [Ramlibacter sp.]